MSSRAIVDLTIAEGAEPESSSPRISIILAAFNEEQDIGRALDSIISQTFIDWELIVIDDGSTDGTVEVVRRYAERDSRIRLVCNEKNLELAASLNKGIGLAQAGLIARADADDINLPERLSKQYKYMRANREIDVLGTAAYLLDEAGDRVKVSSYPQTHSELRKLPFLKNHFFHPSVMIRKRFFDTAGLYDPHYARGQDKELWLRGLRAGCCYANLPEPLIEYSTDGFVMSWRSILKQALGLLRMAKTLEIERGYIQSLILTAYTAAIKLRIYRPKSLRAEQRISPPE